jgi:hypothetical protein
VQAAGPNTAVLLGAVLAAVPVRQPPLQSQRAVLERRTAVQYAAEHCHSHDQPNVSADGHAHALV